MSGPLTREGAGEDLLLTQLVWIRPGQEAVFHAFEDVALPLLAKHGGELLLRVRPGPGAVVAATLEAPYEIHVLRFAGEEGLRAFLQDEERRRFLHLKEGSVRAVLLIRGRAAEPAIYKEITMSRQHTEDRLDEALEESFPASDSPAVHDVRAPAPAGAAQPAPENAIAIAHERRGPKGSFYVEQDGARLAEMTYTSAGEDLIIIDHTEVSDALRGRSVGRRLVDAGVAWARAEGKKILPLCPYARSVFDRDPSLADVLSR
jgi:uncharacterized protein